MQQHKALPLYRLKVGNLLVWQCYHQGVALNCIIDTGATASYIARDWAKQQGWQQEFVAQHLLNWQTDKTPNIISGKITLHLYDIQTIPKNNALTTVLLAIDFSTLNIHLARLGEIDVHAIIGMDFLQQYQAQIDCVTPLLYINTNRLEISPY